MHIQFCNFGQLGCVNTCRHVDIHQYGENSREIQPDVHQALQAEVRRTNFNKKKKFMQEIMEPKLSYLMEQRR